MNEGDSYLLSKLLSTLFKNRSSYVFTASVTIVAIILGVLLYRAKTPDERGFPILGLVFLLIIVLVRVVQAIRRQSVQDNQAVSFQDQHLDLEETPNNPETTTQPDVQPTIPPTLKTTPLPRPTHPVFFHLIAALMAGFLFVNTLCIGTFTIPFRVDPGEGLGYIVGIAIVLFTPVAAGFGALASLAVLWLARRRRPEAPLTLPAILSGAAIGLLLGIVAVRILAIIICLDPTLCSP